MWNINRILRLGIRGKLAVAFTGLSAVPIIIVGIYGISIQSAALHDHALDNLAHGVSTIREKAAAYLDDVAGDMRFIAARLERLDSESHGAVLHDRRALEEEFRYFVMRKPGYLRVHYYSEAGVEQFRINASAGRTLVAPTDELGAGGRHYQDAARGLRPGQILFEPVELTLRGSPDSLAPAISTILRFAPWDLSGGELVLDVDAKDLFRRIESTVPRPEASVMIAGPEGFYLYHSRRKNDWNRLLASRELDNVSHDFPPEVAARILGGETGTGEDAEGSIVSFAPLIDSASAGPRLAVVESIPTDAVFSSIRSLERLFGACLVLFLGAALGLSYLATQQFVRPIRKLSEGAEVIARGEFGKRIAIETYDEIEHLAGQFNAMAVGFEEHERELARHREHLEQMVAERTGELEREKEKLENAHALIVRAEKLATTGEMSAVLAHEIRNSLTSVKMILQLERERPGLPQSDREALDVALRSTAKMEAIVAELLQFARPAAPARRRTDLNAALEASVALAMHQIAHAGARIEVALAPDLPAILGDADRLQEAFVNLLLNAAQATGARGCIRVTSGQDVARETREDLYRFPGDISPAEGPVDRHIIIRAGTRIVRASIADTGCGIPADRLERIFDPFFTTRISGTGLGLSLVKRIASEHGALVVVESVVGAGSTFSLIFPVPEDAVA